MANILFVHNNFPGRFGFLLPSLLERGHVCVAIAQGGVEFPGTRLLKWKPVESQPIPRSSFAGRADLDFNRGKAAADCAIQLRDEGFIPDLVIGHPGWGETTFIKEVFPASRQILVGEYYYITRGGDVDFDPEFKQPHHGDNFKVYAQNAAMAMAYADADRIVFPTRFQASTFPRAFRERADIIHEGIDTDAIKPMPNAKLRIGEDKVLDGSEPIVTFINRTFEPLRGFHIMVRSLPKLMEKVPNVRVIMIGANTQTGYGIKPPKDTTWPDYIFRRLKGNVDFSRLIFTGLVPHATMLSAVSMSWAHVYYTYPFVLSWSAVEAMALEALVLGSDTPPVSEVIQNNVNGILNNFFDVEALSDALIAACTRPKDFIDIRKRARQTVIEQFDRKRVCLPAWMKVIEECL